MRLETPRLIITKFDSSMAGVVHFNSLDDNNRRFVPDEVFETVEEAAETIDFLMECYDTGEGPQVFPVLLKDGTNVGYVQLVPMDEEYEVGYHIAERYTGNGYASEALKAFLDYILFEKNITKVYGVCVVENLASRGVLGNCGFAKIFEGKGNYQGEEKEIVKYVYNR